MSKTDLPSEEILASLDRLSRRIDSLQKTQDLFYDHLRIFEDIQITINQIKSKLDISSLKQEILNKDLKSDLKEVKEQSENTVEEIAEQVTTLLDSDSQSKIKPKLHTKIFNKLFRR